MNALPRTNYLRRSYLASSHDYAISKNRQLPSHSERIKHELRALGMSRYGLRKMESRYLPHIIHPNEHLRGVVYGLCEGSSVLIAATDQRIIFLDRKPLFINEDEIAYDVVGGVKYSQAGLGVSVTLHTRIKDYTVQTMNEQAALSFVNYIEMRTFGGERAPPMAASSTW